jgi:hypothetical protein
MYRTSLRRQGYYLANPTEQKMATQTIVMPDCESPASIAPHSSEYACSLQYLEKVWPDIQPHIREAIFVLVDAALCMREDRTPRRLVTINGAASRDCV